MGLLNIIRRMALRERQSIQEISRRTGLLRNTIAKYLSAGMIEPTFTVPESSLLGEPKADVEHYDGLRLRTAGGRHAS